MTTGAIILAAGRSARMDGIDKMVVRLGERPLVAYAIEAFAAAACIDTVLVVVSESNRSLVESIVKGLTKVQDVVLGGERRRDSVHAGLVLLTDCDYVVVHDGARPLVEPRLIEAALTGAREAGAALCAVEITDTVKRGDSFGRVRSTVSRENLWLAQTPQAFRVALLMRAHDEVAGDLTDDAAMVEHLGLPVRLVPGSRRNIKVTTPADLDFAAALLARPGLAAMRVGQGYDMHPFEQGRALVLGGVIFEGETGLAGHSDGDVLSHAVIDALLGATALGDIGTHFPSSDDRWRNADSLALLRDVVAKVTAAGYRIENVDATVIAERPRIAPRAPAMRRRLAEALGVEVERVSVKATTTDRLGAIGRGEGIAAMAVALLEEAG